MPDTKNPKIPHEDVDKMTKVVNLIQEIYAEKRSLPFLFFVSFTNKRTGTEEYKCFPGGMVPPYIMREFIQHMINKKNATSVISCGEGYAVILKGEDVRKGLQGLRPSQHPERKDIIFFTYENKESYWIGKCEPLEDGSFSEIDWEASDETGGHFGNLFPGKKVLDPRDLKVKDDNHS